MSLIRSLLTKRLLLTIKRCFSTSLPLNTRKVAVVLSGSGVYDGSEIHEASAILVHLTRSKAEPFIYAPDVDQMHVVNHIKGEPSTESRNVLVESARIARGNIKSLTELDVSSHDAIVFPGGFGVAKNLSTFAVDGENCKVIPEVEKLMKAFHAAKKPIALCCISPTLAARVFGKVEITLGQEKDDGTGMWPYCESVQAAKSWGAIHHNCNVDSVVVDKNNLIVTTPAFMYATKNFHEIYEGIGKMIHEMLRLIKN